MQARDVLMPLSLFAGGVAILTLAVAGGLTLRDVDRANEKFLAAVADHQPSPTRALPLLMELGKRIGAPQSWDLSMISTALANDGTGNVGINGGGGWSGAPVGADSNRIRTGGALYTPSTFQGVLATGNGGGYTVPGTAPGPAPVPGI